MLYSDEMFAANRQRHAEKVARSQMLYVLEQARRAKAAPCIKPSVLARLQKALPTLPLLPIGRWQKQSMYHCACAKTC